MSSKCGCGGHHHHSSSPQTIEILSISNSPSTASTECCGGPEVPEEDCCKTSASGQREGSMVGKETGCGCGC